MQAPVIQLIDFQLKYKIVRKPAWVAANLLIQACCRHAIESRQIRVQQHPLPADYEDSLCNSRWISIANG